MLKEKYGKLYNVTKWSNVLMLLTYMIFANQGRFKYKLGHAEYYFYPFLVFGSFMSVATFYLTYKTVMTKAENENYKKDMQSLSGLLVTSFIFLTIAIVLLLHINEILS